MPTDVERLAVLIEANTKSYERAMLRFQQQTDKASRNAEKRFADAGRRLDGVFSGIGASAVRLAGALGLAFGSAQAVRAVAAASQEYIALRNALKVVGLEGDELEKVQARLFAIAQKNGSAIKPLTVLYGRAAQVSKDLKASQEDLLKFTEAVSLGLRVAGTDSQTAAGALLQLSQALASGKVRAQEFNSVNEGALPIIQAVAVGLKEAGGSVGKLKTLVTEGKVSSEAFFRAFLAGSPQLEQQAGKMQETVGQAVARMSNALIFFIGKLDKTADGSSRAAKAINKISKALEDGGPSVSTWITGLGKVWDLYRKIGGIGIGGGAPSAPFPTGPGGRIAEGAIASKGQLAPVKIKPVSINDFGPPAGKAGKGAGAVGVDSFERALAAAQKRIDVLNAETATIGQNTAARERAKVVAELETAAKAANAAAGLKNTEVTADQRAEIDRLAAAQQAATQNNETLTLSIKAQNDVLEFAGNQTIDLINAIGGSAEQKAQALHNVLNAVIQAMLKATLLGEGPLAGLLGTASHTGGPGGLFGILQSLLPHRAGGGPVAAGRAYMVGERGREIFVPQAAGRIVPGSGSMAVSGGRTVVQINNYAGDQTQTSQRRQNGPDGETIIVEIVKKNMALGAFDAAQRGRFGISPQKVR